VLTVLLGACGSNTPAGDDGPECEPGVDCPVEATCGNGVKEGVEACDFGADNGANAGCEPDCTLSCADQAACDDANPCNGEERCDPVTVAGQSGQRCFGGTALSNGASCGAGMICVDAACTAAACGDSFTTPTEECDDANATAGDGCESNCTFSCVSTDATRNCTPADPCAGQGTCNDTTHQCTAGTALPDDTSCGGGGYCKSAVCTQPMCPNGDPEPGETCDDGNQNNGDGCDTDCTYSCVNAQTDCGAPPACQQFTCTPGHVCQAVADATKNGTSCGSNGETCNNGACVGASCGNGNVEPGETCEPPGTPTCDASCQAIVCGDGVRAGTEQCDDSNTTNLDGCSATCKFEQSHRMNDLDIQFGTSAPYCPANALGGAARASQARDMITAAIDSGVTDGSISIIFQMLDLAPLTGGADPSVTVGVLRGTRASGAGYNGNSDLDWWYTIDPTRIDAARLPNQTVQGAIANGTLTTQPGNMTFNMTFVGVPVTMDMFSTKMRATVGAATTPLSSTGSSPGHLASEHLDLALTSFATMTQGEVCGATAAASLANTRVPASLANVCTNYTTSHSLLDVFVGGCWVFIVEVIRVTQPDTSRSGTDSYRFFDSNNDRVVDRCEKNLVAASMADCLQNAGFTSYYRFTTDRVIGK
jgi:cysteine-rich repeat protein